MHERTYEPHTTAPIAPGDRCNSGSCTMEERGGRRTRGKEEGEGGGGEGETESETETDHAGTRGTHEGTKDEWDIEGITVSARHVWIIHKRIIPTHISYRLQGVYRLYSSI